MRIEKTTVLSDTQVQQVKTLEDEAFLPEGLQNHAFLSNEINFNKDIPCFYLGYEGETLTAFLSVFIPSSAEAEIAAVTHPHYRRQGRFAALFACAGSELLRAGIPKILFIVESGSLSGAAVLKSFAYAEWDHAEYTMTRGTPAEQEPAFDLEFIRLNRDNIPVFEAIITQAFPGTHDNKNYYDETITSATREGWLACKNGKAAGCFCLSVENGRCYLYGLAVDEKYRRKGYGRQMTMFALMQGLEKAQIVVLDVDSNNPAAFELYKNCGFRVDFQVDYYALALQEDAEHFRYKTEG
jgi:ribosomal protein S18 acetylase RimI-like enzyme